MVIRRSHQLTLEEAKVRADEIAADLVDRFGVTTRWQGDSLIVRGTGVNGALHIDEETVELVINLGFALKIMEGPIRSYIEESIDDHLV